MPEYQPSLDNPYSPGLESVRFFDVVRMMLDKDSKPGVSTTSHAPCDSHMRQVEQESDDDTEMRPSRGRSAFNPKTRKAEPVSSHEIEGYDAWRGFDRSVRIH
jgi:hypothetical protein